MQYFLPMTTLSMRQRLRREFPQDFLPMTVVGRQCCLRTAQSTTNHFLQPQLSTRPPSSLAHVTALPSLEISTTAALTPL